jgi:uncharacterized membrane protein
VKTKSEVNQFVAREDVGFVLEPAVKALLTHGMTPEQVLGAVTESAKRVIRLSLSDAGEKLSVAELSAEAERAAKQAVQDVRSKAA